LGNSIVRAGQSSNSSLTAGVSEETVQKIQQAEANGQQVSPALAQQFIKESIASSGATDLSVQQDGDRLIVGANGLSDAIVDTSQLTDFQSLTSARQGLEGHFGDLLRNTSTGRALNLSFADSQRVAINERINTPITDTAAFKAGVARGHNNAAFHARDRVAGILNDARNNQIGIATSKAIYARDQAASSLSTLEKVQLGLDVAGASEIPVLSQVADLSSGGISLYQGDYVGATLSLGSAIPVVGKAFEGTRAARFAEKIADRVTDLAPRFRHGIDGRLESAFAKIEPHHIGTGTGTTEAARLFARSLGKITDDAGHAIGKNLGGLGGRSSGNIFPQAPSVNRGAFRQFEQQVAKQVAAGKDTFVRVVPKFEGSATRPHEIVYQVRIDGKTITRTFGNP
jgi:hypothetical protein